MCALEIDRHYVLRGRANSRLRAARLGSGMRSYSRFRSIFNVPASFLNIPTTSQLLSKLPSTVRGVGLILMGSFNRKPDLTRKGVDGVPAVPGYNQDMATLVGYIAVVRRHGGIYGRKQI